MCVTKPIALSWLVLGFLASTSFAQSDPPGVEPKNDPAQNGAEAAPAKDGIGGDPFGLSPKPSVAKVTLSAAAPESVEEKQPESLRSLSIAGARSETVEKIRAALSTPVAVQFNEAPLSEVVDYLKDAAKIPIIIDKKALDDVGLGSDTPVTIAMQGISLRSFLRIMLGELDLTFAVRDDVLKITTPEEAENELETRLYPVADLAQVGRSSVVATRPDSRFHLICDLIQTHVCPDTWHNVGGAGSIIPDDAWGFLAVSQTDETHEKIEALLATVRRAREIVPGSPQEQESLPVVDRAQSVARARISEALQHETQLEFVEAPLRDVVEFIKSTCGIPAFIDKKALDDVGLGTDTPVTVSLQGISLNSALHILLKELDLRIVVQDEVLMVTTPEEAENNLTDRVFLVRDFSRPPSNLVAATMPDKHLESLAQLIQRTIAPDSWDAVGGAGVVHAVEPWGLLIVSQTDDVHQQIDGLLSAARNARSPDASQAELPSGMPGAATPGLGLPDPPSPFDSAPLGGGGMMGPMAAAAEQTMLLKPYVINIGFSTEELTALIKGTIPGRWTQLSAGSGIFPVGNTLLIRQTAAAHSQIEELLRAINAITPGAATLPPGTGSGFF